MPKKKKTFFEEVQAEVMDEACDYVKEKVKKKVLKITEISILSVLAIVLISIGLAQLLATYFPVLVGGWSYILLGVIFLLVALLLKM